MHLVSGLWGTIGAGLLAVSSGLFYGHGFQQLFLQIIIALVALLFSGVLTAVIGLALKATMGWRVSEDDEEMASTSPSTQSPPTTSVGSPPAVATPRRPAPASPSEQAEGANA